MSKHFYIPVVYFLLFLVSKEVFSYDSEKVVILCILSFFFTAYYQLRTSLYESFLAKSAKLQEEFSNLAELKYNLEKSIRSFWRIFLDLEDQLIEIFFWIRYNIQNYIKKTNKNRVLFAFHVVKDQLNILIKENLVTTFAIRNLHVKKTINNFYLVLNNVINNNNKLDNNFFISKLNDKTEESSFKDLIINKLDKNTEVFVNQNTWVSLNKNIYL